MKKIEFKLCKNNSENRDKVRSSILKTIDGLELDKDIGVTIKNYDTSKTAKQRRLQWRWYTEIADSGLGSSSNKNRIHLDSKWYFAKPLLLAGSDDYSLWVSDMWSLILENYPHDAKRQMNFFENAVHTEKMEKDMISEFLKDMQYYWTSKGVRLTDPSLAGL